MNLSIMEIWEFFGIFQFDNFVYFPTWKMLEHEIRNLLNFQNKKISEFSKGWIFRFFLIWNSWYFLNWIFIEFSKLDIYWIFQIIKLIYFLEVYKWKINKFLKIFQFRKQKKLAIWKFALLKLNNFIHLIILWICQ